MDPQGFRSEKAKSIHGCAAAGSQQAPRRPVGDDDSGRCPPVIQCLVVVHEYKRAVGNMLLPPRGRDIHPSLLPFLSPNLHPSFTARRIEISCALDPFSSLQLPCASLALLGDTPWVAPRHTSRPSPPLARHPHPVESASRTRKWRLNLALPSPQRMGRTSIISRHCHYHISSCMGLPQPEALLLVTRTCPLAAPNT